MIKLIMEWALILGAWFVLLTQIIIPVIFNTPMFPFFRKRLRQAEADLQMANEQAQISEIEQRTKSVKDGDIK